jgi:hypothetical protein
VPAPSISAVQNLLANGNFAQDLAGWTVGAPSNKNAPALVKAEVVADPAAPSGKILKLTDDDPAGGLCVYQDAACTAGTTYVATVVSKCSNNGQKMGVGYSMISFIDGNGKEMVGSTPEEKKLFSKAVQFQIPGGDSYAGKTEEVTAPAGAMKMRVRCSVGGGSTGVANIANVEVLPKQGQPNATPSPVASIAPLPTSTPAASPTPAVNPETKSTNQ